MATKKLQPWARAAWQLSRRQHGVVTRRQLLALGMPPSAIRSRLERGQLHQLWAGVYAVGRPEVTWLGRYRAATLVCGPDAQLSHHSAAALWGIRPRSKGPIDVVVPSGYHRRRGIRLHRRPNLGPPRFAHAIPVVDPITALVDIAIELSREEVEEAVNEADHRGLVHTPDLRRALDDHPRCPGLGRLRSILDSQTFSRSQTALERRFLPIARAAGLPAPGAQIRIGKYRVDFHWPELGLVVETDSLTYHRTVAQQTTDMKRDQTHARAGLRTLRFNHHQVFRQPGYVREVLEDTVGHLR